jgi:glutamine synthetase
MNEKNFQLSPNILEQYFDKPASEFTKSDIIHYIRENGIKMLNFHYVPEDGRIKTLNFIINSHKHLDEVLSLGERVDGSSLFSYINPESSDLYVVPRFKTAFIDLFSTIPTLGFLCSFFDAGGNFFEGSPSYMITKARTRLERETGFKLEAMGELEYYIITDKDELFPATDQKGYHESSPFNKTAGFRREAMDMISKCGGRIKYAHSEVGNFTIGEKHYEQNEIEFLPVDLEDAADQLVIAKWILRKLAFRKGFTITFSPKITVGKAGSGLHIHLRLTRGDQEVMLKNDGSLSDVAKKAISGILHFAPSLTAFGNTNPTSYFRLVPNQEAPTTICWGDRNRAVLVRVPLGWSNVESMMHKANEGEEPSNILAARNKQTFEFRCPDGSADIHLLIAGLTLAVNHGLNDPTGLEKAEALYFRPEEKANKKALEQFEVLPVSCHHSAMLLKEHRAHYERESVFPHEVIDRVIQRLLSFNDVNMIDRMDSDIEGLIKLVDTFFHCG